MPELRTGGYSGALNLSLGGLDRAFSPRNQDLSIWTKGELPTAATGRVVMFLIGGPNTRLLLDAQLGRASRRAGKRSCPSRRRR